MPEPFYADLGNSLVPIAADGKQIVAEWVTEANDSDYRGRMRQLYALVFTQTDPVFLLRTSVYYDGEASYPVGDEILSEGRVSGLLAEAGVSLPEPLEATVTQLQKQVQAEAAEDANQLVVTYPTVRMRAVAEGETVTLTDVGTDDGRPPCPYRLAGKFLYIRVNNEDHRVPVTPSESRSVSPLINSFGEWVSLAERADVPRDTYSNHLGRLVSKIRGANLPLHIQRPGGPGKGSAYRISPAPL